MGGGRPSPRGSGTDRVRPHLTFLISLPLAGQRRRGGSNGQNHDEKKMGIGMVGYASGGGGMGRDWRA